jgi:hypothetical protein
VIAANSAFVPGGHWPKRIFPWLEALASVSGIVLPAAAPGPAGLGAYLAGAQAMSPANTAAQISGRVVVSQSSVGVRMAVPPRATNSCVG